MRRGFNLIELIIAIVIMGILAYVAVPSFSSLLSDTHMVNLKKFVTTLNTTTAPILWGKSLDSGYNGSISKLGIDSKEKLAKYIKIPPEIESVDLTKCNDSTKDIEVMQINKNIAGFEAKIVCRDGNMSEPAYFKIVK